MKKTLEQILEEYKDIEKQLIENEGELNPELEEILNINRNELHDKIDAYYYISQKLINDSEFDKQQEERFNKRKKAKLNSAQRLKDRIDMIMPQFGEINLKSKGKIPSLIIETENVRATGVPYPQLNPETLPENLEELDSKYLDYIISLKISKDDAKFIERAVDFYAAQSGTKAPDVVFQPVLNTNLVKNDVLEGIEIGEIGILTNYKTRFS